LPAVPSTCPKHRSAMVINGQQRSVTAPAELHQQPSAGSPTLLPKLAVARTPWSAPGPHGIGSRWFSVGTSGHARRIRIAGHGAVTAPTSDGEAAWRWVRTPTSSALPLHYLCCLRSRRSRSGSGCRRGRWNSGATRAEGPHTCASASGSGTAPTTSKGSSRRSGPQPHKGTAVKGGRKAARLPCPQRLRRQALHRGRSPDRQTGRIRYPPHRR
jgi:hypothetical protein